jgi:hypothetical protein
MMDGAGEDRNTMSEENARKAILGKWELVSYGEEEDCMVIAEGLQGSYTEYLPDGTLREFMLGNFPGMPESEPSPAGIVGAFGPLCNYTIEESSLTVIRLSTGVSDCYKYKFYDNNKKLRLTRNPWYQKPKVGENTPYYFMTNIWIYKKIEL